MFYILSDSDQILSISFCEECQQKLKKLQNGLKLLLQFVKTFKTKFQQIYCSHLSFLLTCV